MPTYSITLIRYKLCFPTLTERVLCVCLLCAASSLLYAKKTSHGSCFSGNMLRVSPSEPWLMVTYIQQRIRLCTTLLPLLVKNLMGL